MTIEFDHRIGKLTSLLIHTLSSFTTDNDFEDEYAHSEISGPIATSRSDVVSGISKQSKQTETHRISSLEPEDELEKVVGHENRVRWLERKMHEQSLLVTDFINCGASEPLIEKERQKLRQLELMRFKEFRHSFIEKFRRKADSFTEPESLRMRRRLVSLRPVETVEEDEKSTTGSYSTSYMEDSISDEKISESKSAPAVIENPMSTLKVIPGQKQPIQAEVVDMNIDVQITVESGQCILRTQTFFPTGLSKNVSARDLKNKSYSLNPPQSTTNFAIPSVGVNAFYTSEDPNITSPTPIRLAFPEDLEKSKKNGCLYLALELASMPDETLVTPHLADFVEQVIEPLPENLFEPNVKEPSETNTEREINTVPIVTMDTSALPIDILFHAAVQSSTLRFEGQQQWSSAADCLLTLPRFILYASTRKSIADENIPSGIYLSATLSDFSLTIYSPHQQATAQNALLLTLDSLSVNAIRSKNPQSEEENKVQLAINSNVGVANFNCDMRRFSELLSFPKPWYRQKLIRRIFIGEPAVAMRRPSTSVSSNQTPSTFRHLTSTPKKMDKKLQKGLKTADSQIYEIDWSAAVICKMKWKELNVRAQMSNTMGNTTWLVKDGVLNGHLHLNSKRDRDVALAFELDSSEMNAQGGAISGEINISKLHVSAQHKKLDKKPPENVATSRLDKIENRFEWMSRPIFIGRVDGPSLRISDEWRYHIDTKGEVTESLCFINIHGSWSDLQTIITTVTSDDVKKIVTKLLAFFKEQIKNSKVVWGKEIDDVSFATDESSLDKLSIDTTDSSTTKRKWHRVLDLLTDIQMRKNILPLPIGRKGVTIAGGTIEFEAGRISLACMNGEMNAASWALFHLRQVSLIFTCTSKYAFSDEDAEKICVNLEEKFILKLGNTMLNQHDSEIKADVCRVQHNRNFILRYNASIDMCLESLIGDVLKTINLHPESPTQSRFSHKVLELFQFPAMEAVLTTVQNLESNFDSDHPEAVHSSFVSEFHNAVAVQTDFNAQIGFLPDLLKSYTKSHLDKNDPKSPKDTKNSSEKSSISQKDPRKYECERWIVDPRIRFIERFKWNPPVIDEILRKLQIFDHRTTIPKVMQRGVLDRCDTLIAEILELSFRQVLRE